MKIMVTGAGGSGGSFLVEHLVSTNPNDQIIAAVRGYPDRIRKIFEHGPRIEVAYCDLADQGPTFDLIKRYQPEQIYHLASVADVRASFDHPLETFLNNAQLTANLLEACRQFSPNTRILICSTSEVYGQVMPHEVPIREEQPLRPASPYSVSKVSQDLLAQTYFKSFNMNIVITRMFTYLNPRRLNLFSSSFAHQIFEIETGRRTILRHGNLESVRTIIDTRDAIDCYRLVMNQGLAGEVYNLGGGSTIKVGDFLNLLIQRSKSTIKCELDPQLLRPTDVSLQIPDTTKFVQLTGWKPKFTLEESVQHLMENIRSYWGS